MMKKILITLILFFNLSVGLQEYGFSLQSGTEVQAQRRTHRVDCPQWGEGFWGWLSNAAESVGSAVSNVMNSIGSFFDNLFPGGDDNPDGEGPGEEEGEDDYGYDPNDNSFLVGSGGDPFDDPYQNVWNDPFFNSDGWGSDEWGILDDMGLLLETYYNEPGGGANGEFVYPQTLNYEVTDKEENPTSGYSRSTIPCVNSFITPFKKIIHFTQTQLNRIVYFHFDGNHLEYFIDVDGSKFINAYTPQYAPGNNSIIVGQAPTYKFYSLDNVKQDISWLASTYGTSIVQKQDIDGHTRDVITNLPSNNLNYVFEIPADKVEDCGVGKQVEARTTAGIAYCKTLKAEDCARGLGRKRDEFLPYGGLNLDHYANMPDAIREFLKKVLGNIAGPCTISFMNTKLNELHASSAYQNAGNEMLKEEMEYLTVGYYYIKGALYCATNEDAAKGKLPAEQFKLGALHEVVSTIDVVQLTEGLLMIAKGLASQVDQAVLLAKAVLDQVVNDVVNTGTVDYEKIFKKIVEAATSEINGAYEKVKQICDHMGKIYFTQCDQHHFGDGSVGDICAYRRGELTVMALPVLISGGQWAVVKATALAGKYLSRTGKALKFIDEAIAAGGTITDDAGRMVVNEVDDLTTVVTKEADDIHFKREGNDFEPFTVPPVEIPVINGRRPRNHEFANRIYHSPYGYDVPFNQHGFPNFEQWSERTVQITGMQGEWYNDFAKANKAAFGVEEPYYHLTHNNGQYADYVWHHHEDTKSMMLVPKNLNNKVPHTGGASVVDHNKALPSGATPLTFPSPPLK